MSNIKSVEYLGEFDTYDLEVDHPDHQYYLANGILTSNSHSVSYSYISYYTAWLKNYYPTEFMCALLNTEDPNDDAAKEYLFECKNLGIEITPPNINSSKGDYTIISDKKIATGLSALKGVGDKAIQEILSLQPFSSLKDFFFRTNARVVNKRVIEALAKAGAFEPFSRTRKDIFENYDKYRKMINNEINKEKSIDDVILPQYNEEWERKDVILYEKEVLGRTISGSLYEIFPDFFKGNGTLLRRVKNLEVGSKVKIEVIISSKLKEFKIKKGKNIGKKFAKYLIEDSESTNMELTVWADDYEKFNSLLKDGIPIRAICKVDEYMDKRGLSLSVLENILGRQIGG